VSGPTTISWCDFTWNPIRECSRVSPGCESCYAERHAARFSKKGLPFYGFATRNADGEARWTRKVELVRSHLLDPLSWRTPRRVFVNSMSDLFHEGLSDEDIDRVLCVIAICHMHESRGGHVFQALTKRAERMRAHMSRSVRDMRDALGVFAGQAMEDGDGWADKIGFEMPWPLPNLWLGVSVEDDHYAKERLPHLKKTPAAVRFVSYEPALGPLTRDLSGLDWVIVGGESGPCARHFRVSWARAVLRQCEAKGIACFVKQLGARPVFADHPLNDAFLADYALREEAAGRGAEFPSQAEWELGQVVRLRDGHGGDMAEWPEDLRVRQFPGVAAS